MSNLISRLTARFDISVANRAVAYDVTGATQQEAYMTILRFDGEYERSGTSNPWTFTISVEDFVMEMTRLYHDFPYIEDKDACKRFVSIFGRAISSSGSIAAVESIDSHETFREVAFESHVNIHTIPDVVHTRPHMESKPAEPRPELLVNHGLDALPTQTDVREAEPKAEPEAEPTDSVEREVFRLSRRQLREEATRAANLSKRLKEAHDAYEVLAKKNENLKAALQRADSRYSELNERYEAAKNALTATLNKVGAMQTKFTLDANQIKNEAASMMREAEKKD